MSVVQDNSAANNGSGTSYSYNFTIGNGADRYLLVGFTAQDSGTGVTGVTCTKNGSPVAMTKLAGPILYGPSAGTNAMYVYGMFAPDTGTNNIIISSGSSVNFFTTTYSMFGVKQSNTPNIVVTKVGAGVGGSPQAITTTVAGCGIVLFTGNDSNTITTSTDTIVQNNGGEGLLKCNAFPQAAAGLYTFNWAIAGGGGNWADIGVAVEPSVIKVESTGSATSNAGTTTVAVTASGSNNMLLVAVSDQDNSNNATTNVTGVTCNGVAMTKIDVQAVNAGYGNSISLWGLLGATTGNIVATRTHVQDALAVSFTLYSNVDQSTAIGSLVKTKGGSTASSFTGTLTTSTTYCWTAMGVYASVGGDTLSGGNGTYKRISTNGSINSYFDSNGGIPTASSTTLNVTDSGSHVYGYVMVEIRPYSAPVASTTYANLLSMLM
jgi:hypothetical protein